MDIRDNERNGRSKLQMVEEGLEPEAITAVSITEGRNWEIDTQMLFKSFSFRHFPRELAKTYMVSEVCFFSFVI